MYGQTVLKRTNMKRRAKTLMSHPPMPEMTTAAQARRITWTVHGLREN
jgi:hypothetical protein